MLPAVGETAQALEERPRLDAADTPRAGFRVPLTPEAIVDRCTHAAKRGRLPGFHPRSGPDGPLFRLECPGSPFEGWLEVFAAADPSPTADPGTSLSFRTRLKPLWVWGFAVALVLSIWPGVVLTESLVASVIPGSFWRWTWYWYLPLTVPFAPLAWWQAVKMSRAGVEAEAAIAIDKLASELTATPTPP